MAEAYLKILKYFILKISNIKNPYITILFFESI